MHDLKFAGQIISAIKARLRESGSSNGQKNIVVNLSLSSLGHVTPEGLKETFSQLAESEGLTDVRLIITPLEFEIKCRSCGISSRHSKPVFNCSKCNSSDFDILNMQEFVIDSVRI